ncbi:hypothetical protein [Gordonia shandongensis]|uniref:hypothetical protein n=1 Tax=Gordonia shandongensis TaxID=376351 RepID=UPI00040846E8|nr:hypothetical protein [Gordonia shandongensis]
MLPFFLLTCLIVFAVGAGLVRSRLSRSDTISDRGLLAGDVAAAAVSAILVGLLVIAGVSWTIAESGARVALIILVMLAAAATGGPIVRLVLAAGRIPTRGDNHDDEPQAPLRGGRVIGVLERAAVVASLLAGWPAGLAVLLGVKGLARFSELRAPRASEQFILGTFASVLWACAMAGAGHLILT